MLGQRLQQVLFSEMRLEQTHFFNKFNSFKPQEQSQCQQWMIAMLNAAQSVYQPTTCSNQQYRMRISFEDKAYAVYDAIDNLAKPSSLHEFMDGIYDCFRCYAQVRQQELVHDLFTHTNRGGDEWFPLVIINQTLAYNPNLVSPKPMTIYRGCDRDEFNGSKKMGQCWTKSFSRAQDIANNPSLSISKPVVLETTLHNDNNVVYADSYEDLIVLKPQSSLKVKKHGQAGSSKDCVVC